MCWGNVKAETFSVFEENQWLEIFSAFERHDSFPNCLGAFDGKHIRTITPTRSDPLYFNYKNYSPFMLLAVADCNYKFTFVDIGSFFHYSLFFKKLVKEELNISSRQAFTRTNKRPFPICLFVFALSTKNEFLITDYVEPDVM